MWMLHTFIAAAYMTMAVVCSLFQQTDWVQTFLILMAVHVVGSAVLYKIDKLLERK